MGQFSWPKVVQFWWPLTAYPRLVGDSPIAVTDPALAARTQDIGFYPANFIGDFSRHYGVFAGCGGGLPFTAGNPETAPASREGDARTNPPRRGSPHATTGPPGLARHRSRRGSQVHLLAAP